MNDLKAYGIYALVALAVFLPLLAPGFILTLDMVFTPELRMPDQVTASWPFHTFLHLLNLVLPSDIIQKILLFGTLVLAGVGMHRLIRLLQPAKKQSMEQSGIVDDTPGWGIYFASVFFMLNPFTYSRFMAGQYAVLLGYALLPWFVRLLLQLVHRPTPKTALKLGGLAAVIGVVSIHTLAAIGVLVTAAVVLLFWKYRKKWHVVSRYALVAVGLFAILSSFWLVPFALGRGSTAETINSFTAADTAAFETRGGNPLAKIGNVLRLQGFWAEDRGQFLLPQQVATPWGLMALIIVALVVTGAVMMWRRSRPLAVFFGFSLLAALLIAVGLLPSPTGYREPHKIVAVVALSFGVFAAFGVDATLRWLRDKAETAYIVGAVVILILPMLFMRVMLLGFHGQLHPRQYPAEWTTINQQLNDDPEDYVTLFLPWHQYMSFGFSDRIIANPAPNFFDKEFVVSTDPELDGAVSLTPNSQENTIKTMLADAKNNQNLAKQLAEHNIKYIFLAKEVDYQEYDFVAQQPDIEQVADYQNAVLYRNNQWREQ